MLDCDATQDLLYVYIYVNKRYFCSVSFIYHDEIMMYLIMMRPRGPTVCSNICIYCMNNWSSGSFFHKYLHEYTRFQQIVKKRLYLLHCYTLTNVDSCYLKNYWS